MGKAVDRRTVNLYPATAEAAFDDAPEILEVHAGGFGALRVVEDELPPRVPEVGATAGLDEGLEGDVQLEGFSQIGIGMRKVQIGIRLAGTAAGAAVLAGDVLDALPGSLPILDKPFLGDADVHKVPGKVE